MTKISLLVSRKVDPDDIKNPDDKAWYGQFGFRFNLENKGEATEDYVLSDVYTFLPEALMFVLSLLNLTFLKVTQKASNNKLNISRKVKRLVPSHIVNRNQGDTTVKRRLGDESSNQFKKLSQVLGGQSDSSMMRVESNHLPAASPFVNRQ